MKILFVAATELEIKPLLDFMGDRYTNAEVLITGVGMIATAYQLGKRLAQKRYDIIVNAGIAGSFNRKLDLGTVVQVVDDQIAEFGAEEKNGEFLSIFDLGFAGANELPFLGGKLVNKERMEDLREAVGLTVQRVHGCEASIKKAEKRYAADIETMEGAAFFYVCLSEKVPFVALRAISNYVEPRDRDRWEIPLAVARLNEELIALIKYFEKCEKFI